MKRLVSCESTKEECDNVITTKLAKGQMIFCGRCKRHFVENTLKVKK